MYNLYKFLSKLRKGTWEHAARFTVRPKTRRKGKAGNQVFDFTHSCQQS